MVVLKQLLNLIPRGMVSGLARQTGVEAKARTFSVMSHLRAMLFVPNYMPITCQAHCNLTPRGNSDSLLPLKLPYR